MKAHKKLSVYYPILSKQGRYRRVRWVRYPANKKIAQACPEMMWTFFSCTFAEQSGLSGIRDVLRATF